MVARMRGWKTALRIGLSWLWPAVAMAEPPPPAQRAQVYSAYEQQTIDEVLHALRAQRDPNPEGKTVEDVVVVPLEVFEPRDPVPQWLNVFHVTTRKAVIRRELLLHVGDKYAQVLVDDTLRNIRRLPELSLVLVLTATGTTPDRIRVVVCHQGRLELAFELECRRNTGRNRAARPRADRDKPARKPSDGSGGVYSGAVGVHFWPRLHDPPD